LGKDAALDNLLNFFTLNS